MCFGTRRRISNTLHNFMNTYLTFTEGIGEGAKNHVFYYYYVEFQFIAMHQRIYFTDKLKQVLKWIMEIIKTFIST